MWFLVLVALAAGSLTDSPTWRGQGSGWAPMMAQLVDRQTGETSAAVPWVTCMDNRNERIKASGAMSLQEHYRAGERYQCEVRR